ncbi:phosphoglycerate mutase [Sporothrix schenckii 1099-18]|uniref:Phosphoglycerate mutase n=1 Tax=Sporothrix schenckii 1099-18 TaxID=1397361 RepID=A0A0F2LW01_SPOSC|nr:phosphoglycerate mutase [Sporothrix schenckii 1099-18]KJR81633.1 phosphoglycerate mutase [Sporothrix schenckii 1099-18]
MSDQIASTPRVFIMRHASARKTSWAKIGRYTGITEVGLTETGIVQVSTTANTFVGARKLIDPSILAHVFVSPRMRAKDTLKILLSESTNMRVTETEDIAEWAYGDYEGKTTGEIRLSRKERGLDLEKEWSIWRDGCEGGE